MEKVNTVLVSGVVTACVFLIVCTIIALVLCLSRRLRAGTKSSTQQQTLTISPAPSFNEYHLEMPGGHSASRKQHPGIDDHYVNYTVMDSESCVSVQADKLTAVWHKNKAENSDRKSSHSLKDKIKNVGNITCFRNLNEYVNTDNSRESASRSGNIILENPMLITQKKCNEIKRNFVKDLELSREICSPADCSSSRNGCAISESDYEDIDTFPLPIIHHGVLPHGRSSFKQRQKTASCGQTSVTESDASRVYSTAEAEREVGHSVSPQNTEAALSYLCTSIRYSNNHNSELPSCYHSTPTVTSGSTQQPFSKSIVDPCFHIVDSRIQKDIYSTLGEQSTHTVNEYSILGNPLPSRIPTQRSLYYCSTILANQISNEFVNDVKPCLETSNTPVEICDVFPSSCRRIESAIQEPHRDVTTCTFDANHPLSRLTRIPEDVACRRSGKRQADDHIYYELEKEINDDEISPDISARFEHSNNTSTQLYNNLEIFKCPTYPLRSVHLVSQKYDAQPRNNTSKENTINETELSESVSSANSETKITINETSIGSSGQPQDKRFIPSDKNEPSKFYSLQQLVDPSTDNSIYYELESESELADDESIISHVSD